MRAALTTSVTLMQRWLKPDIYFVGTSTVRNFPVLRKTFSFIKFDRDVIASKQELLVRCCLVGRGEQLVEDCKLRSAYNVLVAKLRTGWLQNIFEGN